MSFPVTEHIAKSARHTTFYLACGGAHRPVIIFVHGCPELSSSWRHQLPCFASLGFRCDPQLLQLRAMGWSAHLKPHDIHSSQPWTPDL